MSSPLGIVTILNGSATTEIASYKVYDNTSKKGGKKVKSIFGRNVFSPFPSQVADDGNVIDVKKQRDIHNDDMYDLSVAKIIEYTNQGGNQGMKLTYADFAYLKNLGVYPNNRLIVARRFGSGIGNDLHLARVSPIATLVSWIPESQENFFNVTYNEVWVDADASYTSVLNDLGKDMQTGDSDNRGKNLGDFIAGGLNLLPFPGFSEPIQRAIMAKFGLVTDPYNLPLGNPNLIREAKRRKTVSKDEAESGLAATIEIDMVVEYEQKFINGVDPSLVYLDIIQNAITFGTSNAAFQMASPYGKGVGKLIENLMSGNFAAIFQSLFKIVKEIFQVVIDFAEDLIKALIDPPGNGKLSRDTFINPLKKAFNFSKKVFGSVIGKYKVRLMGITNALTGSPSCPWHITIGNPRKPIFSSGDMLLKSVNLELGKTLAFNDLPSSIKITLKFENARPLGAQEIFNRLNTGKGRSYIRVSTQDVQDLNDAGDLTGTEQKKIITGSFEETQFSNAPENDATPEGDTIEESQANSDQLYAQFEEQDNSVLIDWLDAEGKPVLAPANTETKPTDMATAARDENGSTVRSSENNNQGENQPSANQSSTAPVNTEQKANVPNLSFMNASPAAETTPLNEEQIRNTKNIDLQARKAGIKKEEASLIQSYQALDQPRAYFKTDENGNTVELYPGAAADKQKNEEAKDAIEEKIAKIYKEKKLIDKKIAQNPND
jgi:hypothetical protein